MTASEVTEPVSHFWSRIGMVADIARILRERPFQREAFGRILKHIADIMPLDAAALYLLDKKRDRLEKIASHGSAIDLLEFVRFKGGDGLSGWVAGQKQPIVIQGRDPETDHVRKSHDSVMVLPLMVMDDIVGVLCCSRRERQAFDENRQRLMEIIADQMAVSLELIFYQQELETQNRSLDEARNELDKARAGLVAGEKLKAVGELAAAVNQEVSNTLSIIIGNAQIIELEAAGLPENLTRQIRAIVDSAKRISLITHKLLKIDRLVAEDKPADQDQAAVNQNPSAGEHT